LAVDGGVLNITAAAWTAGFHWWRSGNKKRTQNVSEYMLVLALCLVCSVKKPPTSSGDLLSETRETLTNRTKRTEQKSTQYK